MAFEPLVAQRYAEALFNRALGEGVLEALAREVQMLLPALVGNAGLREFFESPNIPRREKRRLIERTLAESESSQLDELMLLMLGRGRIDHLVPTLQHFLVIEEEHRGFFNAEVATATALGADQREALSGALERHTGHHLDITFTVDPDILGGVVFRHRDDLIDSSLRSGIEELGAELSAVRVH